MELFWYYKVVRVILCLGWGTSLHALWSSPKSTTDGADKHWILKPYPKPKFNAPSNQLVAIYHQPRTTIGLRGSAQHPSPLIKLDLKTKIPAINLDNIEELTGVECTRNKLILTLRSLDVVNSWNVSDGIGIMVNPHWECFGEFHARFLYSNIMMTYNETTVLFKVQSMEVQDIIENFDFMVKPNDDAHRDWLLHDNPKSKERGTCPSLLSAAKTPFEYSFKGQIIKIKSSDSITGGPDVEVECHPECLIKGSAALSAHVSGSGWLNTAKGVIKTGILSALDMKMGFRIRTGGVLFRAASFSKTLLKLNLMAYSVPGVFSLGPYFKLALDTHLTPTRRGALLLGFRVNHSQSILHVQKKYDADSISNHLDDHHPHCPELNSAGPPTIELEKIDAEKSLAVSLSLELIFFQYSSK